MIEPSVYRALFEVDNTAVLLVEGDLIVDANARARAAFGDAEGDVVGQELLTLLAPVQPDGRRSDEMLAELVPLASANSPRHVEWVFAGEDGPLWARVRVQGLTVGQHKLVSLSWRYMAGQRVASGTSHVGVLDAGREKMSTADREIDDVASGVGSPDEEVPIAVLGGVVGALGVRGGSRHSLTEEERELLESISRQTSSALQRARLLDEARDHARRERLIRDIADKMQRATDLQSLLTIAAEELVHALGATHTYIRMGTREDLLRDE